MPRHLLADPANLQLPEGLGDQKKVLENWLAGIHNIPKNKKRTVELETSVKESLTCKFAEVQEQFEKVQSTLEVAEDNLRIYV